MSFLGEETRDLRRYGYSQSNYIPENLPSHQKSSSEDLNENDEIARTVSNYQDPSSLHSDLQSQSLDAHGDDLGYSARSRVLEMGDGDEMIIPDEQMVPFRMRQADASTALGRVVFGGSGWEWERWMSNPT